MAKYLDVDFKSGNFYEWSPKPLEGGEKRGNVYVRFHKKAVTGQLMNVTIHDSNTGQKLQVALKTSDGIALLRFPLYDSQNFINSNFAEPVIARLANMEKDMVYTITPYLLTEEAQRSFDEKTEGRTVREKYYAERGVSIKLGTGDKIKPALVYAKKGQEDENTIPQLVWRPHPTKPNTKKPSAASLEAKTDFLIAKLMEQVNGRLIREEYQPQNTQNEASAPAPQVVPQEQPQQELSVIESSTVDEEYDDLPF